MKRYLYPCLLPVLLFLLSGLQALAQVSPTPSAPGCPVSSSPETGQLNVPVNPMLEWSASTGENPITYDLYIGTSRSSLTLVATGLSSATYQPHTLLEANTVYYYRIAPVNGNGSNDTCTVKSFTTSSGFSYCTPQSDCSQSGKILKVVLDTLVYQSQCSGNAGSYSIIPPSTATTSLILGQSYNLQVYNQDCTGPTMAWIDFNQDGDFEDAGESFQLTAPPSCQDSQVPATAAIQVPSGAVLGPVRMRIRSGLSGSLPCGPETKGETEDYTINIINTPACSTLKGDYIKTNVDCAGGLMGEIALTASGGTAPYQIQWTGPIEGSGPGISEIAAGIYYAHITDAAQCSLTVAVTVTEPLALLKLSYQKQHLHCKDDAGGWIKVQAEGGTAPYTIKWTGGLGGFNPTNILPGKYMATVTDNRGCSIYSPFIEINEFAVVPKVTNIACKGDTTGKISLNISGGTAPYTIAWSGNFSGTQLTHLLAGTYTATVTDSAGCRSVLPLTVTSPDSAFSIHTTAVGYCSNLNTGAFIKVDATGGVKPYSYNWTEGNASGAYPVNLAAGYYKVVVKDSLGCMRESERILIQETPAPQVSSVTRCGVGKVTLQASGGTSYIWYADSMGTEVLGTGSTFVTPFLFHTDTFYVANTVQTSGDSSCDSKKIPVIVTIDYLNMPRIPFAGNDTLYCGAQLITLRGAKGSNYKWYGSATGDDLIGTGPAVPYNLEGRDSLFLASEINNCESLRDTVIFDVLLKKPVITASSPLGEGTISICEGDSVTLYAPDTFSSYLWSLNAVALDTLPEDLDSLVVKKTGVYRVQVGGGSCLSGPSDWVKVNVLPLPARPSISVQGNLLSSDTTIQICSGDSVILHGPDSYARYLWQQNAMLLDTLPQDLDSLVVKSSGTFLLQVVENTCLSIQSDTIKVEVLPLPATPVLTIKGINDIINICNGDSVIIHAPHGYDHYLWHRNEVVMDTLPDGQDSIVVKASASFFVQGGNNGCWSPASDTVKIVVHTPPARPLLTATGITISPGDTLHICSTDSLILHAPKSYIRYMWQLNAAPANSILDSIVVKTSGAYAVQVGDAVCLSTVSDTVFVTVHTAPSRPAITVRDKDYPSGGTVSICSGDSLILYAPKTHAHYSWSRNSSLLSGLTDSSDSIVVKTSGTYSVEVADSSCMSLSSAGLEVIAAPIPAKPDISAAGPDSLSASIPGARFTWKKDGQLLSDTIRSVKAQGNGSYEVAVQSAEGCVSPFSDPYVFTVASIAAARENLFRIYPNPGNGIFYVAAFAPASFRAEISTSEGNLVRTYILQASGTDRATLDLSGLPPGLYFVKLIDGSRFQVEKLIKY